MGEVSGELLTMLVEEGVVILFYLFSSFSFSRLLGVDGGVGELLINTLCNQMRRKLWMRKS